MLSVIEITQIELFALKKYHSKSVQSQSAGDVVVENSRAKIEALIILASLSYLTLLFRKFAHLVINVRLFQEISLLNACLCLHDQILGTFSVYLLVERARASTERNCRSMVLLRIWAKTDIS